MSTKFLDIEREFELARAARAGDRRAKEALVRAYMPFAHNMAFRSRSLMELEDKQQVAMIALSDAIDRFDPERGYRLSTYARPRIARDLSEAGSKAASRLTLGSSKERRSAFHNAIAACDKLGLDSERRLTDEQAQAVATSIRASVHDVRAALQTGDAAFCVSIDELVDETTPEDLLILADENERRARLLEDSIEELDDMERELVTDVLLSETPASASAIIKRHRAERRATAPAPKVPAHVAKQRSHDALVRNLERFARARNLGAPRQA